MLLLAACLPSARAFSLWGPVANGGDSYQTPALGYDILPACMITSGPFVGAPKNLHEEYRVNVSTLYYSYDQNFLNYFGSNGVVAIDSVFSMLSNHLSAVPLTSRSASLSEFPLNTTRVNYRAQTLGILDIRTTVAGYMMEELGLADPVQWAWTLRERRLQPNLPCPNYDYSVFQRNFDPLTPQPSRYINGRLYTYQIFQGDCTDCDNALVLNFPADPGLIGLDPTPVASFPNLADAGKIYTGLTRDDMGGLRYLMSTNNLNVEGTPLGSTLISGGFTNRLVTAVVETADLALLAERALTNAPGALQALYPGLAIASSYDYLTNLVTTNITVTTQTVRNGAFQIITNTGTVYPISTLDLAILAQASKTNPAAALEALYPGLVVSSEGTNYVAAAITNVTPYFYVPPYSVPPFIPVVGYTTNYFYYFATNYVHTFANVITNFATNRSVVISNTIRYSAPWDVAGTISTNTTSQKLVTTNLAGDFYVLPTNLCGYVVLQTLTNVISTTNLLAEASTNNGNFFSVTTITYFTNHQLLIQPITCYGHVTNFTTNVTRQYGYSFDNVVTNHFYRNTPVTLQTTNIYSCGLPGLLCTNITTTNTILTNVVSGDFYLLPTNQCGLSITHVQLTNTVATTNLQSVVTNSNGSVTYQGAIRYFTNYTLAINPVDCDAPGFTNGAALRQGINSIRFVRHDYDSLIGQFWGSVTNVYTNVAVQGNEPVPQVFRRVINSPDILFTVQDLLRLNSTRTALNFDSSHILPGLAGPGTRTLPIVITFNSIAPLLVNSGPDFLDEPTATTNFIWGTFDTTTNAPIVYPTGTDITALENQIYMQITTSALPDATSTVAYGPVTLSGSGGTQPYVWSLAVSSPSGLPAGLTISAAGVISGTPAAGSAGVYDLTVQMADAGGRTVFRDFVLTVN